MKDTTLDESERRNAIERELRDRLARDRARARPREGPAPAADPGMAQIALECAACRGLSAADAQFCTRCGVRFNATVVARRSLVLAGLFVVTSLLGAAAAAAAAQASPGPPLLSTAPQPTAGATAQPTDMSGLPLQVADLPPGTVAVRVIRRTFAENVAGLRVNLAVGATGRALAATTDADGRAVFHDIPIGETVRARTTVDGERLTSQFFELPAQGGVRLVLVAGLAEAGSAPASAVIEPPAVEPAPGRSYGTAYAATAGSLLMLTGGALFFTSRGRRRSVRQSPRERIFDELLQLEKEHEAGAVSDDVHTRRRETLIEKLLELDP